MKFLFAVGFLYLLHIPADFVDAQNCCEKLKIPTKCHFLCGTSKESWISITRWKCTHSHGAAVAKCTFTSSIDYVKVFGDRFTKTIQQGFDKLSASLQAKLTDAAKFASATVDELKGVGQDILASLSTLTEMTSSQFKGLVSRFTSFTTANLRNVFSKVKLDVIFQNIKDLANNVWDLSQMNVILESVYKKYGKDVSAWTSYQLSALGNLVSGIPSSDLAKVSASAFDKSVTSLCKAKLKLHQKMSLITPASFAYGRISTWNSSSITKLCNLVEALTPEELLELGATEIVAALDKLKQLSFSEAQIDAILKKMKEKLGAIPAWTQTQLQSIGKMAKGLESSELAKIDKDKIKNILSSLGNIKWDTAQARKLAKKLQEALGIPETWTSANLNDAKRILQGLVASELAKLKDTSVGNSLRNLKNANWTVDQAQVILGKIKKQVGLRPLTKDDILAIANTMDTFASSDVGKLSQSALFAAFPELILVKSIATPVLRQFIKVYKDQPGNQDISLLGGMAHALTRIELNKATVTDIIASLEKLTGNDWDEAQIAELMIKARAKLGQLNLTETADVDSPPWGYKNLKRMGKVVLGFTKNELRTFPIRGIEDSLEVLGSQSGWKRGQVVAVMLRFREYLKMRNVSVETLGDMDIEALGSLAQGFAVKELKSLSKPAMTVAIRKIGEKTGLPEDKIRSISYAAVKHFKDISGTDILDTNQVQSLGNLIVGVSKQALSKISKSAFLSEAYNIAKRPGMNKDKWLALIDLGKKHYGQSDTGKWLSDQWKRLGPALQAMKVGDIRKINKEAFDGVIDYLGEMDGWSVEQAQALVLKAKEFWNQKDVSKWSGEQLRRLGSLVRGLNTEEIRRIGAKAFKDMLGSCAHFSDLKKETLTSLAARAKQVLASGDAGKFNFDAIKLMGCAVQGLTAEDLAKLKLDIDIIAELGKQTGWDQQQLKRIASKVKQYLKQNVNDENLMSVGNAIKGFSSQDIQKLSTESFRYAAGKLGKIDGLNMDQIKSLASKAKESHGNDLSQWSSSQISEAGNILSGLSTSDIPKINTDAINTIPVKTLQSFTKQQVKSFTTDQIKSMDSTQVYSLSKEQRSLFSAPQMEALASVEGEDPKDPDPWASGVNSGGVRTESSTLCCMLMLALAVLLWQRA